jgi:hypothetical protein
MSSHKPDFFSWVGWVIVKLDDVVWQDGCKCINVFYRHGWPLSSHHVEYNHFDAVGFIVFLIVPA